MSDLQARARFEPYEGLVSIHLYQDSATGGKSFVSSLTLEETPVGGFAPEPALRLTEAAAQQLMDDLYREGIRPKNEQDARGIASHLSDMRKIVSAKLGIDL